MKEYKDCLKKVLAEVKEWRWNDPVSSLYDKLFRSSMFSEPKTERKAILAELDRRQRYEIPPGFRDSGKPDRGVGDLLIWYTIMETGRDKKKNIIFVSGDEKSDWWHRVDKKPIYPRFELVYEFKRFTSGNSFYMVSFSHFLELFGAETAAVLEVREKEAQSISSTTRVSIQGLEVDNALWVWLNKSYPHLTVIREGASIKSMLKQSTVYMPDYLIVDQCGDIMTVDVKFTREKQIENFPVELLSEATGRWGRDSTMKIKSCAFIVVSDDPAVVTSLLYQFENQGYGTHGERIIFGYINSVGNFEEIGRL